MSVSHRRHNSKADWIVYSYQTERSESSQLSLYEYVLCYTSGDSSDGMCKMDGCTGPAVECLSSQDHCTLSNTSACFNDTWTCVEVFKTCELEGYVCKSLEAQFKKYKFCTP
jgi:hypothetical protein